MKSRMISIKCEDANSDTCVPMFFFSIYTTGIPFFLKYIYTYLDLNDGEDF